jgi:hypothetical protein
VSFRINGVDANDDKIYSIVSGNPQEGLLFTPTASAVDPVTGQVFKRITSVQKGESDGYLTVWAFPTDGLTAAYAVGRYEPFELVPQYRRLVISREADWVRLATMPVLVAIVYLIVLRGVDRALHAELKDLIALILEMGGLRRTGRAR